MSTPSNRDDTDNMGENEGGDTLEIFDVPSPASKPSPEPAVDPNAETVKSRILIIDCPYCEETEDVVFAPPLNSVWVVGPMHHTCSGCRRQYTYIVEIDLSVSAHAINSELVRRPK